GDMLMAGASVALLSVNVLHRSRVGGNVHTMVSPPMLVLLAAVLIAAAIVIGAVFWSRLPRRRQTDPGNSATRVTVASAVPGQTGADADGGEAADAATDAEQAQAEDPNAIRPLTGYEIFTKLCEFALGRGRGTELASGHEGIAESAAAALLDAATQ